MQLAAKRFTSSLRGSPFRRDRRRQNYSRGHVVSDLRAGGRSSPVPARAGHGVPSVRPSSVTTRPHHQLRDWHPSRIERKVAVQGVAVEQGGVISQFKATLDTADRKLYGRDGILQVIDVAVSVVEDGQERFRSLDSQAVLRLEGVQTTETGKRGERDEQFCVSHVSSKG